MLCRSEGQKGEVRVFKTSPNLTTFLSPFRVVACILQTHVLRHWLLNQFLTIFTVGISDWSPIPRRLTIVHLFLRAKVILVEIFRSLYVAGIPASSTEVQFICDAGQTRCRKVPWALVKCWLRNATLYFRRAVAKSGECSALNRHNHILRKVQDL